MTIKLVLWWWIASVGGDPVLESARSAGGWLLSIEREDGLFRYGWEPSLDRDLPEENWVRQAGTAAALARAGSVLGDPRMTERARQVIGRLMEKRDRQRSLPSSERNRLEKRLGAHPVGWTALLLLALAELETRSPAENEAGDRLAESLLARQRGDGSIRLGWSEDAADDDAEADEEGWAYYPGEALLALASWGRVRGVPALVESVQRSRSVYWRLWRQEKEPAFIPWQSAAHAEVVASRQDDKVSASFVFEMNDWLINLQYEGKSAPTGWEGGFGHYHEGQRWQVEPGIASASYAESLVEALRVASRVGDSAREERYRRALGSALAFVGRLQYRREDVSHFSPAYQALLVGAFFEGPSDGTVRIDFTQHALMAMGGHLRLEMPHLSRTQQPTKAN
jgi:hypothetical protein